MAKNSDEERSKNLHTYVQTFGRHGSNDLFVWEHCSASSVEKGTKERGNKGEGALRWVRWCVEVWRKSGLLGEGAQTWSGSCVG